MKSNQRNLKTQQKFKSERHNVFAEEINKIALNSKDVKITQSIDSIETYAYRTSKDLVSEKEEIKCKNILKSYKKWLNLMLQRKTQKNIIQIDQKFLPIHAEY